MPASIKAKNMLRCIMYYEIQNEGEDEETTNHLKIAKKAKNAPPHLGMLYTILICRRINIIKHEH